MKFLVVPASDTMRRSRASPCPIAYDRPMHPAARATLRTVLLLACVATLATACGGRQVAPPADMIEDPVVLYEALLTRMESVESVRMGAMLEYYGEGGRARVEQGVIARAPDRLRMDTITPFGTTLAVFVLNAGRLTFYDLNERVYATGPATPENVSRFVPFWMSANDLIRVLLGGAPLDATDPDPDTYTLEWDGRAGAYALEMPLLQGGTLTVLVRHNTWTLAGATSRDTDGDIVFELRTGDFTTIATANGETEMPQRLRFIMESEDVDISLDVTRIEMGVNLPDAAFELAAPGGAEVIQLP